MYCSAQLQEYPISAGRVLFEGSHAWKQRDMGNEDAWKPANLTTGRGGGPVEHANPCRRTFAVYYPPSKHPQPVCRCAANAGGTVIFTRQAMDRMRFVHHTSLTFYIRPPLPLFHGKKQRGLPGHSMLELPPSRIHRGLGTWAGKLSPLPRQPVGPPLYNMRICASFSSCLPLPGSGEAA